MKFKLFYIENDNLKFFDEKKLNATIFRAKIKTEEIIEFSYKITSTNRGR